MTSTKEPLLARLDAWRRRATEPSPALVDEEDRRRAATISNVALALAIILTLSTLISLFTSTFFPDPDVSLGYDGSVVVAAAAAAFWLSLRLARKPTFERGAWCIIITIDVFLFGLGILFSQYGAVLALGFAAPVLCATIFLRARGTIAVFVLSGLFCIAQLAVTEVGIVDGAFVVGIVFAVTALTVVVAIIREGDLAQVVRLRELEKADSARLRGELDLARRVQQAMLPDELPHIPELDLAVFSEPAFEASGDFYDVFELEHLGGASGPALGIVVADVAGKGVASALVMSATRAALRAEAERNDSLAAVLAKVNTALAASVPPELFVTLCYAVFDPTTRTLRYSSAGHPHPLWWSREGGNVAELESYGMPLGLQPGSEYEEFSTELAPGDVVMLFTDGLVEALDGARSMYGFDRVREDFTTHSSTAGSAASRLDAVLGSMREFVADARLEDDVTVVTLVIPDVIDLAAQPGSAEEEVMWAKDR